MSDTYHKDLVDANLHKPGYVQSDDPGEVGAGILWIDTTETYWVAKIRNDADDGWETVGSGDAVTPSSTDTLTNKTFDANGTGNSISNIDTADLSSPTGSDTNVVTGTAGSEDDLGLWDSDGDMVSITPSNINTDNLLLNGAFKYWYDGTSVAPSGWTLTGGGSVAQEGTTGVSIGSYSAKVTSDADGNYLEQEIHSDKGISYWQGKDITVSALVYAADASNAKITVADGVGSTSSSYHAGDSSISLLTVTRTIDASATKVEIQLNCDGDTKIAYFDGAMLVEGSIPFAYTEHKQDHLYEQEVKHISPIKALSKYSTGDSRYEAYKTYLKAWCKLVDQWIIFPFNIPRKIADKTTVIDEITIYYEIEDGDGATTNDADYITEVELRSNNHNKTSNIEVSHTGNIGDDTYNGTGSHNIIDTPYEMTDSDHTLRVNCVHDTTLTDVGVLDIEVKYHAKVAE